MPQRRARQRLRVHPTLIGEAPRVDRRAHGVVLAAFALSALLAGGNAVGIRFSNRELDPLWGAGLRFLVAAALLVGLMVVLGLDLPRGPAFTAALLYGVFNFAGAFALAYYALVELHAGFGQILLAIVPLATLLLAVLQRQERLRAASLAGSLIALLGIALISQAPVRDSAPALSIVAALASAFCFAQAAVVVRHVPTIHPVTLNAVGMTTGAAMLLVGSVVAGEETALPERSSTWAALAYLVAFGSVIVFMLYTFVLRHWAASRAAYLFVLVPLVTVALSAWLDNEPIRPTLLLGGLLVLAGVYIGALRRA